MCVQTEQIVCSVIASTGLCFKTSLSLSSGHVFSLGCVAHAVFGGALVADSIGRLPWCRLVFLATASSRRNGK
jgi:hypothetical protein